jgi:FtsZ-binding cell division protein ZapB
MNNTANNVSLEKTFQDAIDAIRIFDLEIVKLHKETTALEIKISTIQRKQDEIMRAFDLTNEDF